jgi:ABC-2 type transport system ATP-binding protein
VIVRELLMKMRDSGKTVFLSSHLLSEVELICDRVAVLNRGRLVRLGKTADLLQTEQKLEITARGINGDKFAESHSSNGVVHFKIAADAQRATLEQVWQMGGQVVSVNPVRRSLEDLFLELTASPVCESEKRVDA